MVSDAKKEFKQVLEDQERSYDDDPNVRDVLES